MGNLSAQRGYAIAQELEGLGSMEDSARVDETFARLKDQVEQVSRALSSFVAGLKDG